MRTSVRSTFSTLHWQPLSLDEKGYPYADNTHTEWTMLFSQHVRAVSFWPESFDVAPGGSDHLMIRNAYAGNRYYGSKPWAPGHWPLPTKAWAGPFEPIRQERGASRTPHLRFAWHSDEKASRKGYKINRIRVSCDAPSFETPKSNTWVERNYPYEGYLLGTDDVIYVHTKQAAHAGMSFLLWPYGENRNFDLYVSTDFANKLPGPTKYDARGVNTNAPELVVLEPYKPPPHCRGRPGEAEECRERWVFLAIHSAGGHGQFRFYANIYAYHAPTSIDVRVKFAHDAQNEKVIRTALYKLAKALYFASDGRHLVRQFKVRWRAMSNQPGWEAISLFSHSSVGKGRSRCRTHWDACWGFGCKTYCQSRWRYRAVEMPVHDWCTPTTKVTGAPPPCDSTGLSNDFQESVGQLFVHELGHCIYGNLPDEYENGHYCGHSVMATAQNLISNSNDFCTVRNGGRDSPWTGSTHSAGANNWSCLSKGPLDSWIPFPETERTPDPFNARTWLSQQGSGGTVGGSERPFSDVVKIVYQ